MIKALRNEKDYYQKQMECLRKEIENIKITQQNQSQILNTIINIFDQPPPQIQQQQNSHIQSYHSFGDPQKMKSNSLNSANSHGTNSFQQQQQHHPQTGKQMGQDSQLSQLQREVRELKFELSQKEENLAMKIETIRELQDSIEGNMRSLGQELERLRREVQDQRDSIMQKDEVITMLKNQCDEMSLTQVIEIPLLYQNSIKSPIKGMKIDQKQARCRSQNKNMFKNKLNFMRDIYEEAEHLLDESNTNELLRIPHSQQNTSKKQKNRFNGMGGVQSSMNFNQGFVQENLIDVQEIITNQIQAARVAECTLQELQASGDQKLSQFDEFTSQYTQLQEKFNSVLSQKKDIQDKLVQLSKENDSVKSKFATLLDQFQEYVNLNEEKQKDQEEQTKQNQDLMLQDLTTTIKELEQLSGGLQQEIIQKDELYSLLKNDFTRLEGQYSELSKQHSNYDNQKDKQIKSLEDEINYLKKHYEVELGVLVDENEILKRELQELNLRNLINYSKRIQTPSQKVINNYQSPSKEELQDPSAYQGNYLERGISVSPFRSTTAQQNHSLNYNNMAAVFQDSMQINKVQSTNSLNYSKVGDSVNQSRVKDIINSSNGERLKKEISDKEKVIEEKNQEILRLRIQIEEQSNNSRIGHSNNSNQEVLRKNLLYDLNIVIGKLKTELSKCKAMLVQENSLIEQFDSNISIQKKDIMTEDNFINGIHNEILDLRNQVAVANEIALLISYDQEKNKSQRLSSKRNSSQSYTYQDLQQFKLNQGASHQKISNGLDQNYQLKRTADNMLRTGQINQIYELLLTQVSKAESLMQDNAILQRTLYKYEATLSELDNVLRDTHNGDVILDLKRIAEQQLQEIVSLQREVEIVKYRGGMSAQNNNFNSKPQQDSNMYEKEAIQLLKQQNDDLRTQLKKSQPYQVEIDELVKERQDLLTLCEDLENQVKAGHKSLEEALDKIMQLENGLTTKTQEQEALRQRITEVAELFEKKEIKQKYSFEVLCDFIFDKAKRLFSKYENLAKEHKALNSEKNFQVQKKYEQIEQENDSLRSIIMQNSFVVKEIMTRVSDLLGEQLPQFFDSDSDKFSHQIKLVLEKIESAIKDLKQENYHQKEKLQEFMKQQGIYQNQLVENKEQEFKRLLSNEEYLKREIDSLKKEKEKVIDRNSDLALALKELTDDFKIQKDENDRLKERLFIYERTQTPQQLIIRQHGSIPPLNLMQDVTNRSTKSGMTGDRSAKNLHVDQRVANKEYCEVMPAGFNNHSSLLSSNNKGGPLHNAIYAQDFNKLGQECFENNSSSYLTDEDEMITPTRLQKSENKHSRYQYQQFY